MIIIPVFLYEKRQQYDIINNLWSLIYDMYSDIAVGIYNPSEPDRLLRSRVTWIFILGRKITADVRLNDSDGEYCLCKARAINDRSRWKPASNTKASRQLAKQCVPSDVY